MRTSATAPSCSARSTRSSQHRAESASHREARGSSRKRMRGWRLCSTSWMYWGKTRSIGSCQHLPEHSREIFQPKLHLPHPAQPLGAPHPGHSMSVPFLKAGKSLPGVGAGIWWGKDTVSNYCIPLDSLGNIPQCCLTGAKGWARRPLSPWAAQSPGRGGRRTGADHPPGTGGCTGTPAAPRAASKGSWDEFPAFQALNARPGCGWAPYHPGSSQHHL